MSSFIPNKDYSKVIEESQNALKEFKDSSEEEIWYGVSVNNNMLDFNVFDGDVFGDDGMIHCSVYLCRWDDDEQNYYITDTSEHLWSISKIGI